MPTHQPHQPLEPGDARPASRGPWDDAGGPAEAPARAGRGLRDVPLLEEEEVAALLSAEGGMAPGPVEKGELLALTTRRVIAFLHIDGRRETRMAFLEDVDGLSVNSHARDVKPLLQGLFFLAAGAAVYLALGTFSGGGITLAAFLGGAVALLGVLYLARFLTGEQGGELVFHGGGGELRFPYASKSMEPQVYEMTRVCFQLKAGEFLHGPFDDENDDAPLEDPEWREAALADERYEGTGETAGPPQGSHSPEDGPDAAPEYGRDARTGEKISPGSEMGPPPGPGPTPGHGSDESGRRPPP